LKEVEGKEINVAAIEDAKLCNDILVADALFLVGGREEGDQRDSHQGCKTTQRYLSG
jgi:hypothetical protein